ESTRVVSFTGDAEGSRLVCLSDQPRPRFEITFGGRQANRPTEIIVADDFIAEKSYKARGKRLTNHEVEEIREIDPLPAGELPEEQTEEQIEEHPEEQTGESPRHPEYPGEEQMTLDFE
ncbi:MAG: DNA gyrase/topoisomerase IV subunit A, partial [Odoribacteraceae bacterium]|nr:DNA gyrase/topoisomerase IV subunit A [Odoribacteraceae bacterium]